MFIAISLTITYLIALIAAGHGVIPIGYLMVLGDNAYLEGRIALSWVAVIITLLTALPQMKEAREKGFQLIAAGILYLSWLSLISMGEKQDWFLAHAILSIPFQITIIVTVSVNYYRIFLKTPNNAIKKDA